MILSGAILGAHPGELAAQEAGRSARQAAASLTASTASARAEAALSIARDRAVEHIPALQARLSRETDKQAKQAVAIALANLGVPAFDALKAALADPLPEVRLEAVVGLGRIGTPAAAAELLIHLARESNDGVRMAAAFWLGQMKHAPAADALGALMDDPNPHLRVEAANSLGRIGTPRAKAAARQGLADKDPRVKKAAEKASR